MRNSVEMTLVFIRALRKQVSLHVDEASILHQRVVDWANHQRIKDLGGLMVFCNRLAVDSAGGGPGAEARPGAVPT